MVKWKMTSTNEDNMVYEIGRIKYYKIIKSQNDTKENTTTCNSEEISRTQN